MGVDKADFELLENFNIGMNELVSNGMKD